MSVTGNTTRDYSIDFLRIVSMLMIVSLHSMSHGGMYDFGYSLEGINPYSIWFTFVQSICVVSVNVYVLISGYFLVKEKFRISKLLKIVCEVLFYSWIIISIRIFFCGLDGLDIKELLSAFLPITYIEYWFVSAYIAMYVLVPVLNLLINSISRRQLFGVVCILVSVFSILNSILPLSQIMGVKGFGQSMVFFVVLYIIGAFLRLYIDKGQWRNYTYKIFWVSILFMNLWHLLTTFGITTMGINILNNERAQFLIKFLFYYNSLPVLIASITLFHIFRGIAISNIKCLKIIKVLTPLVFGVYLIHDNPHIRDYVWMGLKNLHMPQPLLPIATILYTIVVFLLCLAVDYIRFLLFNLIYKREWYRNWSSDLDKKTYEKFNYFYSLVFKDSE